MTLVDNIVIMGNTDLSAINEVFTVNISALTPFTKYYYIVSASNSVGTTNTSVLTFMTNETGMYIRSIYIHKMYYSMFYIPYTGNIW